MEPVSWLPFCYIQGYRKLGVMIGSSSGVIGAGTLNQYRKRGKNSDFKPIHKDLSVKESEMCGMLKLNYMGQTLGNRLLHVIIPKKHYGANKEQKPVFEGVMEQWADDALRLQRDGVRDRKNRLWRLAFVGNLADWPQQAKTGCLQRCS